ncbi:putative RNA polymerase sigma factor [Bordetella bronchiseptica GA96-01]|uniref:RNA polymerase sigma factor n=1 Tax=Bordetella bronchiseptica TaxID=518 RepID=UPI0004A0B46C|nr:RNA polymerase sigma factor [Bordetella bronchiseptica]AZW29625.1 RNA polymerase sigma factor [Bordetella bronchiseptica]KDC38730.1 putative RNA polymerase sigma factor [Bordetella bronchiseptica GA96-01]
MGERFFGVIAEAYKTWNAELVGFLDRQLKRSPETARDLAQETFAKWLAASEGAQPPDKPRAYLYEIARNLLRDHWRREGVRTEHVVASLDDHGFAPQADRLAAHSGEQPEARAEANQRLRLLQAAIDEMPPRQREAFLLYRYDELRCEEIAEHMGISVRAVEKHLQLALAHCKRRAHGVAS